MKHTVRIPREFATILNFPIFLRYMKSNCVFLRVIPVFDIKLSTENLENISIVDYFWISYKSG